MRRGLLKKWPRAARLAGDSSLGWWGGGRREPLSVRWERLLPCRLPEASVPRRRVPRVRSIRSTVNTRQESSHPRRIACTLRRLMLVFAPVFCGVAAGTARCALSSPRPPQLQILPRFQGDALKPELSGGDLCIQACSDDPQVAVHAIRNLSRI